MTSIQTGFVLGSEAGYQLHTSKPQKLTEPFDKKVLEPLLTLEERQKQVDEQNSVVQSTVIELNGKIVASFGENGARYFSQNSDVKTGFAHMTDQQVASALKEKYGGALEVNTYPKGEGPTRGEIFERQHGYAPPRLVDYVV